jgi:hypothetical protein
MVTYIQNNVLAGVFFNLSRMLKDKNYKLRLQKMLSNHITKEHNINKAISEFSDEITKKLFGPSANIISLSHMSAIFWGRGIGYGGDFFTLIRSLIIKISKSKLRYNPETDDNNLVELSKYFIDIINYELNKKQIQKKIVDGFIKVDNATIRNILAFVVYTTIESIALEWIRYGRYLDKVITDTYYKNTLSRQQYMKLQQKNLSGGILFRGLNFFRPDPKTILKSVQSGFYNRYGGSSWTEHWGVASIFAKFSNKPTKPISFNEFKMLVNHTPTSNDRTVFIDSVDNLMKILKYLSTYKNASTKRVSIMLSYPLVNPYSKKTFREPLQTLTLFKGSAINEVLLIPKKLNVIDSCIDTEITFTKGWGVKK